MQTTHRTVLSLIPLLLLCTATVVLGAGDASRKVPEQCIDASSEQMRGDTVYVGTADGGFLGQMQVKPGDKRTLKLYVRKGPAWDAPNACVTWLLATPELATLDEKSGALKVKTEAGHLARIKVIGRLAGAERDYVGVLVVTRPESNPLAGTWHETGRIPCGDKSPNRIVAVKDGIREFEVNAVGTFSVTWHPFESYRDYWGGYQFDLDKRTVSFSIKSGNRFPIGFIGEGTYAVQPDGTLVLQDLWLGDGEGMDRGARVDSYVLEGFRKEFCGHVFAR